MGPTELANGVKSDLIDVIIYGKITSVVKLKDNLKFEESGKASDKSKIIHIMIMRIGYRMILKSNDN